MSSKAQELITKSYFLNEEGKMCKCKDCGHEFKGNGTKECPKCGSKNVEKMK